VRMTEGDLDVFERLAPSGHGWPFEFVAEHRCEGIDGDFLGVRSQVVQHVASVGVSQQVECLVQTSGVRGCHCPSFGPNRVNMFLMIFLYY
jgi:hypothetical protein